MFKTPIRGVARPATLAAAVAGEQSEWITASWGDANALFRVDDARRQLWFAVGAQLALRPERFRVARRPAELASWLETARAAHVVHEVGLGAPAGWRAALARLGPFALPEPQRYLQLFDILDEGGDGADILRHAQPLSGELIAVLAALEPGLRRPKLVKALLREGGPPEANAARWMWRLRRLREVESVAALAVETSVRSGAAPLELLDGDSPGWVAAFPRAPWAGTPRLRPLTTPADLRNAAQRFNNCLEGRAACVRAGRAFFYEWMQEPRMIVELEPDAPFGWSVGEVRLIKNALPAPEHMAALEEELRGVEEVFASIGSANGRGPRWRGGRG